MLFGADNEKGMAFNTDTFSLQVIDAKANPDNVLRHDENNKVLANLLVELQLPVALGVIYKNPGESFEKSWHANKKGLKRSVRVNDALRSSNTWTVS
jgi:hypothetical protein